jgi:hypothetical protein
LSLTLEEMTGTAEDWRYEEVRRLEDRLYKAEDRIRQLERRPLETATKLLVIASWILPAAIWISVIIEIASKH